MELKELEYIVFKPASNLMRKEGQRAFKEGLIHNIIGKKIGNMYHIYGHVNNEMKSQEFTTHIKIDLLNKKLEGIECTCDDFKELSADGYLFMCSHLTGTAYKFFSLASKNNAKETERPEKANEDNINNYTNQKQNNVIKLTRIVSKESTYYEVQQGIGNKKIKFQPNDLRNFLDSIGDKKIKFNYDKSEFATSVLHKDLPLTFTLKERKEYFVLTTHKKFPISLNSKNDVYLFDGQLYVPTKNQIDKYNPLCEKLKRDGEILYCKDIENYNKIISLLSSVSHNINISDSVKIFASNFLKPEFYIYESEDNIYCDVKVNYGNEKVNILKHEKETVIRDYKKEEKILMEIENFKFIKRNDRFMFIGDDEDLFDMLKGKEKSIHSLGIVTFGKGLEHRKVYDSSFIEADLQEKDCYYDFSYSIRDIESRELNSIFTSYRLNDRFYKTKGNGFIDFEDDGVRSFFNLIEGLNFNKNIEDGSMKIEKNKAMYLNENIKNKGIGFIKGTEVLKDIENKLTNINKMDITFPKNLKGVLREYQVNGYKWLKTLSSLGFGGILADEMGLGKTIQTIAFLLSEENKKSIIISPTSLVYNWKDEIEKFAPSLKVGIIHGEKGARIKLIENISEYDVILTTYGTLRMDMEYYEDIIFDYCIIDEAQNIKNSLAQNAVAIKKVKAGLRFALTGTPIENNLTELWSIFDFIMPDYLYSKKIFEEKFINKEEQNLESLKLLIKPFVLRRTKKEVMKELPDKIEKKFLVEMTPAQKAVYKTYINAIRQRMKNNIDGKIEIFSYLTKLRQICLDPSLIIDDYKGGSGKLKVVMELIEEHIGSNGKVLLFSQFTSVLKNIEQILKEKGIRYLYLDGATKSKNRVKMVNEFNNNNDIKIFLISLRAGGTGLNLTSANLVIHFDPWWNPAVENQATDRAHRIGQRNIVEVIKLVAQGTIEEKIILLQEQKQDLIQNVITGELKSSDSLGKLSKEELLELFNRD